MKFPGAAKRNGVVGGHPNERYWFRLAWAGGWTTIGTLILAVCALGGLRCWGTTPVSGVVVNGPGGYPDSIFDPLDAKKVPTGVQTLAVDGDGFLWMASTSDVLARWDGYRLTTYQHRTGDERSLPAAKVNSLCVDAAGRLWLGTEGAGLARYDPEHDDFDVFPNQLGDSGYGIVWAIAGDGAKGLWLGTSAGMAYLDFTSGRIAPVPIEGLAAGARVKAILREKDGGVWAGTQSGLYRKHPSSAVFHRVGLPAPTPPNIGSIYRASDGVLWLGTANGAFVMEGGVGAPRRVQETTPGAARLDEQSVTSIAEAQPGEIWLATHGQGMVAVNSRSWATHRILHDDAFPGSLPDNTIFRLYRDVSGTVWVATETGVLRYNGANPGISTYFGESASSQLGVCSNSTASNRIANRGVLSTLRLDDGSLWLGLISQGIDVFDRNGMKTHAIRPTSVDPRSPLPEFPIYALASGPDGSVFVAGRELYRTDRSARNWSKVRFSGVNAHPRLLLFDAGTLWIGTMGGVWRKDLAAPEDGPLPQSPFLATEIRTQTNSMLRGKGNDLWVGTGNDLFRVDVKTGASERIHVDAGNVNAPNAAISSILLDRRGRLWVATTGGGIWILDGRDAKGKLSFHRLPPAMGVPSIAGDLLEAPNGEIWAIAEKGLSVTDPATFATRILGPADGVAFEDYYLNSASAGPDGRLYFGGPDGLTVIDAAAVRPWNYIPPLAVTEVMVGGRLVPSGRFSRLNPSAAIEIQPSSNKFSVEFASLDYTAPDQNQYEYRLAGFDRDWIKTDSGRRLASYTNLPPGNYTLELRGSNRNGLWGATRRIPVRVLPAWYQTIWAGVGFVVLAAWVLWGLFQLGRLRSTARQRELEQQVAVRTEELRQTQVKLEAMAYSDSLTGLANRRMFTDCFRRMLALKSRRKERFALLMFDIDLFKQVNDTHGHAVGDGLLKEVTARMRPLMRESDCFARLGGDEFGVLASEIEDDEAVAALAGRIAGCFTEPVEVEGVRLTATFSIGVALYPEDGADEAALLRSADAALYEVKREGRNGWQRFQERMDRSGDGATGE